MFCINANDRNIVNKATNSLTGHITLYTEQLKIHI